MSLPHGVAENYDVVVSELVFFGKKGATEDRLHAQDREEIARNRSPLKCFRMIAVRERESSEGVDRHLLEGMILVLPVEVVGGRNRKGGHAWKAFWRRHVPDLDEAIGVLERQWAQKNGVDDAEDGGIRTDAQGEDQYRGNRETWSLEQNAHGVFDVSKGACHQEPPTSKDVGWAGSVLGNLTQPVEAPPLPSLGTRAGLSLSHLFATRPAREVPSARLLAH